MPTGPDSRAELVCPKCRGAMRTYERSGVTVDQCDDCRRIFLDRGELERIVDAEAPAPNPVPSAPSYPQAGYPQAGYPQAGYPQVDKHGRPLQPRGLIESLFGEGPDRGYRRGHH